MFELIGGIQSVQLDDARRPQQLRAEERDTGFTQNLIRQT
jgi:hypothetical protein